MLNNKKSFFTIFCSVFIVLGIQLILYGYADKLFCYNDYNSYTRQAVAWLEGRLDLGENITWLELAIYNGKYYVSFPPFPSYIMLPFAFFCGINTPDNMISLVITLIGVMYASKIALKYFGTSRYTVMLPVMLYSASAVLQVTVDSGVWFFAQNLSLTLSLMSIYYMLENRKGLTMFLLCCAVGCRPLQICILPFALYYIYIRSDGRTKLAKIKSLVFDKIYVYIPAALMASSFMLLNYLRFGNIFEFGHNYLPEFTESEFGQFDFSYILQNLGNLFRMPELTEDFKFVIQEFNGMNIFISFPIVILFVYLIIKQIYTYKKLDVKIIIAFCLVILHILCLLSHKTMGGYHYGNRYIADTLPLVFLSVCIMMKKDDKAEQILFDVLLIFGMVFNILGVFEFYI